MKNVSGEIQFVYDGSASLRETDAWKLPKGIDQVSEEVSFWITTENGRQWEDKPKGFTPKDYAEIMELFKTPGMLQTSQPNKARWLPAFERRKAAGAKDIFVFAMDTFKNDDNPMSGSKACSEEAADEFMSKNPGIEVHVLPHRTTSVDLGLLAIKFFEDLRQEEPFTAQQLADRTLQRAKQVYEAQIVDGLDYLHEGGRVSKTQQIFGGVLLVKPVIGLENGKIIQRGKPKGMMKACKFAVDKLVELVTDNPVRLAFADCQAPEYLEIMQEYATGKFNETGERVITASPWVLNVHLGHSAVVAALVDNI